LDQACSKLAVYGVEGSSFALSVCCHDVVSYCGRSLCGSFCRTLTPLFSGGYMKVDETITKIY
jgi:hypothetical protein